MGTYFQTKEQGLAAANWFVVDAAGVPLGRLASEVAGLIRGKHKATFTPHTDGGDFVIVKNAEKIALTGRKATQKFYYRHSGYIGGIKSVSAKDLLATHPERVIEKAVNRMLPKGKLGRQMQQKLKVYAGDDHPHGAQKPQPYALKYVNQA